MKIKIIIYLHEVEKIKVKYLKNKTIDELYIILANLEGTIKQVNEYLREVK